MEKLFRLLKIASLLAIVFVCLFGYILRSENETFREIQVMLSLVQWILVACFSIWCGTFFFLTFRSGDLSLISLFLIAVAAHFMCYSVSSRTTDAIILLAGVTFGRGGGFALMEDGQKKLDVIAYHSSLVTFLLGLVTLLAFGSWWHLDVARNFYPGTRWTGLWDNPNTYGMLMGAGVVLAVGMLAENLKSEKLKAKMERGKTEGGMEEAEGSRLCRGYGGQGMKNEEEEVEKLKAESAFAQALRRDESRKRKLLVVFLLIAAGMMGTGLVFSYSRGAWLGTAIGLWYLAKAHGKFQWRFVLPLVFVVAVAVLFLWHGTSDNAPWYLKRADLSRPSAQHRVAAWKAGFEIMRDHPFGVGWNKTVEKYQRNYSPPEDGAGAIATNDYLMLGTQLGIPALLCFLTYVALCFRSPRSTVNGPQSAVLESPQSTVHSPKSPEFAIQTGCRSATLSMLVAFWFDDGLFQLPTAVVFWILLELGVSRPFTQPNIDVGKPIALNLI